MKKLIVTLAVGLLLFVLLVPSSAQRGDLYGARALLALEQAFKTTGVLTFPNYAAAPVVCNAANRGVYYYDTTTTDINICGAAGWVAVGGAGFPLTINTIVANDDVQMQFGTAGVFGLSWDVAATSFMIDDLAASSMWVDLEGAQFRMDVGNNSQFYVYDGNAVGAGGTFAYVLGTVNAMDNNDTTVGLDVQINNADHAGINNYLHGLRIWGTIGDDEADEYALSVGAGWDAGIWGNTTVLMMGSDLNVVSLLDDTFGVVVSWDLEQLAGEVNNWETIIANLAIMDGVGIDTAAGLNIAMTNANHTDAGAGVFVYGLDISDLGGGADADAAEYAINIGAGWDQAIHIDDGGLTDDRIVFGDGNDASVFWGNAATALQFDVTTTANGSVYFDLAYDGNWTARSQDLQNRLVFDGYNLDNTGFDIVTIRGGALRPTDGSDIVNMLFLDWAETNWATATEVLNGLMVGDIVRDDNAGTYHAVNVDLTGWDNALYVDGTTQDIDHGATTAVVFSPTLAANDNANDQRNVMQIDVDIPNGSAGLVTGIWIDEVTDDVDTIDSAILIEGGWDSAITIFERGGVATSNPLTGSIYIYLDDSADYSGGGGNDCCLIARDNGGTNTIIATIVLNGACP